MKNIVIAIASVLVLLPLIVLAQSGLSGPAPQESRGLPTNQTITILTAEQAAKIKCCVTPAQKIWVDRQTRIIWRNQSEGNVRIRFGKGEKCEVVSEQKLKMENLSMALGCYITEPLPVGKALIMRLADPGIYEYTIEYSGGRPSESGTISVY